MNAVLGRWVYEGVYFSQGITFTFGALTLNLGERVLVVQDQASFEARHGSGLNIAGEFTSGKLSNDGERYDGVDVGKRDGSEVNGFLVVWGGRLPV